MAAPCYKADIGESMNIRMIEERDISSVLNIYRYYVENTDITFECTLPSYEAFSSRVHRIVSRYPYLVADEGGYIVGYAYADQFKDRQAYDWTCEVSVYLKNGQERRGTGTMLYRELEQILTRMNIRNLNACITWPNPPSVAFHERMGYRKVAHFEKCGYKFDRWIDMIWMQKITEPYPEHPDAVLWRS